MKNQYIAHINEITKKEQTVKEHSENTATLCYQFSIPDLKDMMYVIGLAHDIGKYLEEFKRKMSGENIRVEHSTCGALVVKDLYPNAAGLLMEYCVAGHHSGIPDGGYKNDTPDLSTLQGRLKRSFEDFSAYKEELEIPEINVMDILNFMVADCGKNVELFIDKFAFLTRYCFSCLTDADSIDTAEFCGAEKIAPLTTNFSACLQKINDRLSSFKCTTDLQKTRNNLQQQVFQKANTDGEIYLMNMPTGSGKTLCSMKFALERLMKKEKKRIIYIAPYNSIIDQTAAVFGEVFGEDAEIFRHQSTFSYDDADYTEDYRKAAKSAAENWAVDSIIITTEVQFLESIHANRRGKLRKLHNMADSILVFDEAHLMPVKYLQPCLRAIVYITRYLNSEAIFLTATMPDFSSLIRKYALENSRIVNLIEDTSDFAVFQKCRYHYLGEMDTETLLEKAWNAPSSLIVVNSRKAARRLFEECGGRKYHLSTYMTPFDRKPVLDAIRRDLQKLEEDFPDGAEVPEDRRITIISTSLIEAGIDIDVHTAFRELTGLDSILQTGGRCNREGKRDKGDVFIFEFCQEKKQAQEEKASITKGIIKKYADISCSQSITEYFARLYAMKEDEIREHTITNDCSNIDSIKFKEYAEKFEIIDSKMVSVVVPRDETSRKWVETLKYTGGGVEIVRKLQMYTCSVYSYELDELILQHVIEDYGTGIWCLTNPDYYDEQIGIVFEAKDYIL